MMFELFAALQDRPWLAALPAAMFAALWLMSRRRLVLSTSLLWLLYAGYEAAMKARILCAGECNIRVDLLVIAPLLTGVSAIALAGLVWLGLSSAGRRR